MTRQDKTGQDRTRFFTHSKRLKLVSHLRVKFHNVNIIDLNSDNVLKQQDQDLLRNSWIQILEYRFLDTNSWIQIHGYKFLNTNSWIQILGYKFLDTNSGINILGYQFFYTDFRILKFLY